jgi:GT2 family glycosyltransferase
LRAKRQTLVERVTFSVVSHGQADLVRTLLTELNDCADLRKVRVIVTLNLPHELLEIDVFENLQCEIIRNEQPKGFGANHNQAFQRCDTPWFVILNPDIRLRDSESFGALLARADREIGAALLAPVVVNSKGMQEDAIRPNLTPWSLARRHIMGNRDVLGPDALARDRTRFHWLAGMCLMIDAEAFRTVGGFDEKYYLYCEDYDLCARLYVRGFRLVVEPRSVVVHDARRNSHKSMRYLYWHVSSLVRVWTSGQFWRIVLLDRKRDRGATDH